MAFTGNAAFETQLSDRLGAQDTASELLVAKLVLDDIAALQATQKGKAREDVPPSDEMVALELQISSVKSVVGLIHDYQFASSIDRAIDSDGDQLRALAYLDQAEHDDHRAAVALERGEALPRETLWQRMMQTRQPAREHRSSHQEATGDASKTDVEAITVALEDVHIDSQTQSASASADDMIHRSRPSRSVECVICGDDVPRTRSLEAPCEHHYCRGCVVDLVETSLRDESLHPLRCCHQPLPLTIVYRFIDASLRTQFLAKNREYSIPAGSRIYCPNPRCSTFLGESTSGEKGSCNGLACTACNTVACSQCKNVSHPGEDCGEHQSTLELRTTATEKGWQTCPGCNAIVELSQGCYHITCRCLTQFCYLCAARWKTCGCRQWDEGLLVTDAERRVRNEFGVRAAALQPEIHAERVHRRMDMLRQDHECRYHEWTYRHGCGQCEECGDFLPIFLMRCVDCQTLACRRCSVNRL